MKYKGLMFLTAIFLSLTPLALSAQTEQEYVDQAGGFKLDLVGDWKAVTYNDAVGRQKTEFIYRDRSQGLLKVSKQSMSGSLADIVRREEETLKLYRAGFERSSSEAFGGGGLSGMRLSFYSTDGGQQTASTYYFLQDKNSVWVLRFSGRRGTLDTIRNITDKLARSFSPVQR